MEVAEGGIVIEVRGIHPPGSVVKGPYTPAVRAGNLLFCSGQIGVDPETGKLAPGGTVSELRQTLVNLEALLMAAGATKASVVKTTLFLVDMGEFASANEAYAAFFTADPKPARSTVAVAALPAGARVEIEAVAAL